MGPQIHRDHVAGVHGGSAEASCRPRRRIPVRIPGSECVLWRVMRNASVGVWHRVVRTEPGSNRALRGPSTAAREPKEVSAPGRTEIIQGAPISTSTVRRHKSGDTKSSDTAADGVYVAAGYGLRIYVEHGHLVVD